MEIYMHEKHAFEKHLFMLFISRENCAKLISKKKKKAYYAFEEKIRGCEDSTKLNHFKKNSISTYKSSLKM